MTDYPVQVRLAGYVIGFREWEAGTVPEHDLDLTSEAVMAALRGDMRLLCLLHAVCTGVQAGVIGREHIPVMQAAVGGDEALTAIAGDDKINGVVARVAHSRRDITAAAWMMALDPGGKIPGFVLGTMAEALADHQDALVDSVASSPMTVGLRV